MAEDHYQPDLDSLKPFFGAESGIDSKEKAFAFILGVLYGKVMQVQAARGVNVGANSLTWLKRLTLEGKDLPEMYNKVRGKLLTYGTEGNEDVRALIEELGELGKKLGNRIELDQIATCYFILIGQSMTKKILPKKADKPRKDYTMTTDTKYLTSRREILFLYDIKMGNPNGDPDENRPRVLPDGTNYVSDVRLKRFVRDFLKLQGNDILVDTIEGRTTNLTGRVEHYLLSKGKKQLEGKELVDVILDSFIDARLFGSSLAFKAGKKEDDDGEVNEETKKDKKNKTEKWEPKPEPKTLTGAVQFNMGEVLHKTQDVEIFGTSLFGSDDSKGQGTFTSAASQKFFSWNSQSKMPPSWR